MTDDRPPVDPGAVRVALAPSIAHLVLDPVVVEPMPTPLLPPGDGSDGQRPGELLLDGVHVIARLVDVGRGQATLVRESLDGSPDGAQRTRLVLEAPEVLPDGRGAVRREIVVDGWRIEVDVESERRAALRDRARRGREESARGGPSEVHAIIPGRVVSVSVAPGDAVVAGQELLVVEAMKMQNELRAPRDGTISRVAVAAGGTIEIGDLLLVLE